MKVIFNRFIPWGKAMGMTVIKWIFCRKSWEAYQYSNLFKKMVNHEHVHEAQILDFAPSWMPCRHLFGSLFFYPLYLLEWLIKIIPATVCDANPYRSISFEIEAYLNEYDYEYLKRRKRFASFKYLFKLWNTNTKLGK